MDKSENNILYTNDLLVDFSVLSMINFYVHLGGSLRTHNTEIDKFILFKHNNNSFINLHYTLLFAKNALFFCIEIMFKNGNILFINTDRFADKSDNLKSKNVTFCIGKWPRGTISNYKTSSRQLFIRKHLKKSNTEESETKLNYKISILPTFIVFSDPIDNVQAISKEANYLGIPSFSFVDTNSTFWRMSYWSVGNGKSHYSHKFYHNLLKSTVLRGAFLKIKDFI